MVEIVLGRLRDTRKDRRAITRLQTKALGEPRGYANGVSVDADLAYWFSEGAMELVVAYERKGLVGYALWKPFDDHLTRRYNAYFGEGGIRRRVSPAPTWDINYMAVSPNRRRVGTGRRLIESIVEHASNQSVEHLYALCWKGEEGASFATFRSAGFEKVVTLRDQYKDGSDMTVVMRSI